VKTDETRVTEPAPVARRSRLTRAEAQALTRRRVMEAATDVFAEKGFRAATLTDVADRAGYTIGAVYSNFSSKDELFHAIMRVGLAMFVRSLAERLADIKAGSADSTSTSEELIERELDRMAAAENAVPERWWRLLYEYRTYTATDPAARAELADAERLCLDILARYIDRFLTAVGIVPPLPAIELAELSMALTDGLRAAHADGRSRMTSGEGLRLLVKLLIESTRPIEPA
jgi:AcrR family transcriptional regulator